MNRFIGLCLLAGASFAPLALSGCNHKRETSQTDTTYSLGTYTEEELVWEENFDGDSLNTDNWNYEFHAPGWVNSELQSYDDSTENTYVKDGYLIIQPIKTKKDDGKYAYTSGRINTKNKHNFKYGRIEARIKMPKGQGFLPAFWMMPANEDKYGSWPRCGEIDIAEVLGNQTDTNYGTLHFGLPHTQKQGFTTLQKGNFAKDFHNYAVEWEPSEIRFYVDGQLYYAVDDWFTSLLNAQPKKFPAPYDQPFYIILNVAVGGTWPGNPDDTTKFDESAQMKVDWVRVYQKTSYDENVTRKEIVIEPPKADSTGNFVVNDSTAWEFYTAGSGNGALSVKNGELNITSKNCGELEYSVQVVQSNFTLERGCKYRYSFDAYADKDRTIITGITAPDFNYQRRFGDVKIDLTKKKQHFEYEFMMTEASDPHCRVEYNLGAQDSTAAVHISNIRLEKIN